MGCAWLQRGARPSPCTVADYVFPRVRIIGSDEPECRETKYHRNSAVLLFKYPLINHQYTAYCFIIHVTFEFDDFSEREIHSVKIAQRYNVEDECDIRQESQQTCCYLERTNWICDSNFAFDLAATWPSVLLNANVPQFTVTRDGCTNNERKQYYPIVYLPVTSTSAAFQEQSDSTDSPVWKLSLHVVQEIQQRKFPLAGGFPGPEEHFTKRNEIRHNL